MSASSFPPAASTVVSGDTTSIRPPGSGPASGDDGAGAGAAEAGAARTLSRCSIHAACWRFSSANALRSPGPSSSRPGMRKVTPAFSALTFLMVNASGFVSRSASIMRWTLTESSGRTRVAIDHSVSDALTGP